MAPVLDAGPHGIPIPLDRLKFAEIQLGHSIPPWWHELLVEKGVPPNVEFRDGYLSFDPLKVLDPRTSRTIRIRLKSFALASHCKPNDPVEHEEVVVRLAKMGQSGKNWARRIARRGPGETELGLVVVRLKSKSTNPAVFYWDHVSQTRIATKVSTFLESLYP